MATMRTAGHVAIGSTRLKSGASSSAADSKPRLAASREASELGGPLSLVLKGTDRLRQLAQAGLLERRASSTPRSFHR